MVEIKLKQYIDRKRLDKPYIKGIGYGIIMGMGIMKIVFDIFINRSFGILVGFIVFIIGIILAIKGGDKL